MWSELGLLIIVIAWLIQMIFSFSGRKGIVPSFILCYMAGVIILVVDSFMNKLTWIAILNLAAFVLALLALIAIHTKKAKV